MAFQCGPHGKSLCFSVVSVVIHFAISVWSMWKIIVLFQCGKLLHCFSVVNHCAVSMWPIIVLFKHVKLLCGFFCVCEQSLCCFSVVNYCAVSVVNHCFSVVNRVVSVW